jgi:acyl-coenzyme A synthetase/AMP-(fatty) acid ligase/acyl carrier protein
MSARRRVAAPSDFVPFDRAALAHAIPRRFAEQVRRGPDRVALRTPERAVTYAELDRQASGVARTILAARGPGAEVIAVLLPNEPLVVAVVLGIWKAGKAVVPLDPAFPPSRIAYALADSGAPLLVTSRDTVGTDVATPGGLPVLLADEIEPGAAADEIDLSGPGGALAGIIYTSGTAGQPKGVMQTHELLTHTAMVHTNLWAISPSDGIMQITSPGQVYLWWMVCCALLNGAALCPFYVRRHGLADVAAAVRRGDITVFQGVDMLRRLAPTLGAEETLDRVRLVIMGGDTVFASDVEIYRRHFSRSCPLLVGYGSTESGRISTHSVDRDSGVEDGLVPLGEAADDKHLLLIGEDGRETGSEPGAIGEIAVRSRFLSPGYWRRPDLTAAAFRSDPDGGGERIYLTGDVGRRLASGRLLHLGRKDSVIKVRNFQVSLLEVESVLRGVNGVREAAVIDREDHPGQRRLVAYVVLRTDPRPTVSELRRALSRTLAPHMIPSAFVTVDAIPRNTHDKLDRRALPAPGTARPQLDVAMVRPRTPIESTLVVIWAEVLGLDEIGLHDDFFDLGGDSLLAVGMLARVQERLGAELALGVLFEAPTVAQIADRVVEQLLAAVDPAKVERALGAPPGGGA